jgi:hypothetical protein
MLVPVYCVVPSHAHTTMHDTVHKTAAQTGCMNMLHLVLQTVGKSHLLPMRGLHYV